MAGGLDSGDDDLSENHEINVTPFIDVMLVLLIIFMVAAPLSTVDVAVDLPVSTAKPQPRPERPVFLTIKADQPLALGNDPIAPGRLAEAIDAVTRMDRQQRVFLRADKSVPYGELMQVMNLLRRAGYLKVALVGLEGAEASGEPPPASGRAGPGAAPMTSVHAVPISWNRDARASAAGPERPLSSVRCMQAPPRWPSCIGRRRSGRRCGRRFTVELALLPAPAPVDSPDVAHGPVQQEAKLTPEAAKEVVEKVEKDIPPVDPSPTPDPEVDLPKPQPDRKEQPKEEEAREPVPDKQVPRRDTEAPQTAAPPRVEAEPTPSAAPDEGDKAARARAEATWQREVMRQINRAKRVPDAARFRTGRWQAVVAFTLDQAGQVVETHIAKDRASPFWTRRPWR